MTLTDGESMILNLQLCSPAEISTQIAYLEATPVAAIATQLCRGTLCLYKGIIQSLDALGTLKTEFGTIGTETAPPMDGERKFRICQVLPLLRANAGLDNLMLQKIEEFMQKDARGDVEYNVTVLKSETDLIVKDGNKRTIAFYERRKGLHDPIHLPVFLAKERPRGA